MINNNYIKNTGSKPNYSNTEQIYESADKHIRIYKTRKKFTVLYIAVKQYSKKVHENCDYEYNILKDLNHNNIIKVFGFTEDTNYYNMEMEFCVTQDLSKAIWQNRTSQYSESIVRHVGTQIMLAIRYLHKKGILHCNLKPSNILVDDYGNIRICDFKKALLINNLTDPKVKKNKSAMTPCYTSPELFSENGIYDYKSDIWALGCIIYELATGQVPFFDESVNKLMFKIINENVNFNKKELSKYSDDFIDLIKGLLEKDPEKRFNWGEIEKHSFWDFTFIDADISDINTIIKNNSKVDKKSTNNFDKNKKNPVNYKEENEDEYDRGEKKKEHHEVEVPDQEFKFDGANTIEEDDNYNKEQNESKIFND